MNGLYGDHLCLPAIFKHGVLVTFALQMKKELSDNESITQEVVGNAHIENYAIKMFLYADNEDRSGRFHK